MSLEYVFYHHSTIPPKRGSLSHQRHSATMKSTSVLTSTNRNLTKPHHNLLLLLQPQTEPPKTELSPTPPQPPKYNPQTIAYKSPTTSPSSLPYPSNHPSYFSRSCNRKSFMGFQISMLQYHCLIYTTGIL